MFDFCFSFAYVPAIRIRIPANCMHHRHASESPAHESLSDICSDRALVDGDMVGGRVVPVQSDMPNGVEELLITR
jgi:hypothetical protein